MPHVNVQITREPRATPEQEAQVIRRITDVHVVVFEKDAETTFFVTEETYVENSGIGGESVSTRRAERMKRKSRSPA
jgi:4-oxalocrotonate tautomerase